MATHQFPIDALVPKEMARKAEQIGVTKVNLGPLRIVALAYWFIYLRPSWTGHPAVKSEEG